MPSSLHSRLLALTVLPAAIVGLGTGLAVGTSTAAVLGITIAYVVLGLISFLVAVALGAQRQLAGLASGQRPLYPLMRTAGLTFLPFALLVGVGLAVAFGLASGVIFGGVTLALALYQMVGFQQLDAWLYRAYGDRVGGHC